MRKLGKKVLADSGAETNVYALKGKTGVVTQKIYPQSRGRVKIGGEEWSAICEDESEIEVDSRVVVLGIDGNKLIVKEEEAKFHELVIVFARTSEMRVFLAKTRTALELFLFPTNYTNSTASYRWLFL